MLGMERVLTTVRVGQVWRVGAILRLVESVEGPLVRVSPLNDPRSLKTISGEHLQNYCMFIEELHCEPGSTYSLRYDRSAWIVRKKENGRAYLENPKTKVRIIVSLDNLNFIRLFTSIRKSDYIRPEFQGRRFAISNGPLDDAEMGRLKTLWEDSYTGGRIKELVESGFLVKPQSLWEKIRAFWSRK